MLCYVCLHALVVQQGNRDYYRLPPENHLTVACEIIICSMEDTCYTFYPSSAGVYYVRLHFSRSPSCVSWKLSTLRPKQVGCHFADSIFKLSFSSMKIVTFWFIIYWNLIPRPQLSKRWQWFGKCLGTKQVTNHYLNQWQHSLRMHVCMTQSCWVDQTICNGSFIYVFSGNTYDAWCDWS